MATTIGRASSTGPATRDRYGLFSVAEIETLSKGDHALLGGVQWITGNCGDAVGYQINCGESLAAKAFANEPSFSIANPFAVYAGRLCGSIGFTEAENQRLVVQKLKANEQTIVEQVFSDQLFGQFPGLANNPSVVTVPTAAGVNFVESIGRLEAAFYAAYGQQGVLHLPFRAGEHASAEGLLTADAAHPMPGNSRIWRLVTGTAVSIGAYSGNSPAGAAPAAGHQWLYMTPPVKIWKLRDEDLIISTIEGSLNRSTNQETWLAERIYIVGFECDTVFAIDATLPTQTTS